MKRPTDIIIFTDSYSYSATSLFIKSFQNTGGAITVGFFGNPKIEGTDLFDASQSPTTVESKENLGITTMQKELDNYNFAARISSGETYNFHQPNIKDQIPREYALDPVDFRVNIYSDYSDDLYDKFIKEGKKIHDEVNNQNKCNSKNEKLLLDDDINCYYIPGYDHAHGGYKCGDDNIWDKSKCLPYYCDIGYYFDQYQKKCIENCNLEKTKGYIIYEDNYKKEFLIKKDTTYIFFIAKNIKKHQFIYYYTYQGNNKYNVPKNNYITINPNKNLVQDIYLTIEEKPSINVNMLPLYGQTTSYSFIDDSESLLFIEMSEDFNLYLDNAFKSSKTEFKLAEYNNEMTLENILSHDSKYFLDYKESIRSFQKNQLYLLYVKFHELDPFNIFINPKITEEIIDINNNEIDFLYLENNKVYTLDFKNNLINRLIKLSRETLDAEIFIENKNIKLNSDNLYYLIEDNYKGVLKLHVSKDNALIEFLFKQSNDELEILDFEKRKFTLKNKYNVLAIPKNYDSKIINIELNRNERATNCTIYLGYSISPYNYFAVDDEENIFSFYEKYNFKINEHYKGNLKLMEDEYYCVMIEIFSENVFMNIEIDDDNEKDGGKNKGKLKGWEIALIVIASVIVFIVGGSLLFIYISRCCSNSF